MIGWEGVHEEEGGETGKMQKSGDEKGTGTCRMDSKEKGGQGGWFLSRGSPL